jgi:hypothetical protein
VAGESVIHYHGTPMTPALDMVRAFAAKHAMVSFEDPRQIEVAAEVCQSIVLDNGAFSAWRQGKPYDFDGFATWAGQWIRHPAVEWVVIPDVIDGGEADNDALLRDWSASKATSVPVYHMHESVDRLVRLAADWPRVALGSSGEFAIVGNERWWLRMADMLDAICDPEGRPLVKLHGLRMLDPGVFSKVPLASADSTNVARNVGLDSAWRQSYAPRSRAMRALILMERIERHASAAYWDRDAIGAYQNMQLFG